LERTIFRVDMDQPGNCTLDTPTDKRLLPRESKNNKKKTRKTRTNPEKARALPTLS